MGDPAISYWMTSIEFQSTMIIAGRSVVILLVVLLGFSANAESLRENKRHDGGGVAPVVEQALSAAASAGHAVLAAVGRVFEGIVEAEGGVGANKSPPVSGNFIGFFLMMPTYDQ